MNGVETLVTSHTVGLVDEQGRWVQNPNILCVLSILIHLTTVLLIQYYELFSYNKYDKRFIQCETSCDFNESGYNSHCKICSDIFYNGEPLEYDLKLFNIDIELEIAS